VKRVARDGDKVVLKAEHPTIPSIVVDPNRRDLRILGKVIGVLRNV